MWRSLAPKILRQRLIIEGTTKKIVSESHMESYLLALADVAKMKIAGAPITFTEHKNGSAAYINWSSSGVHFYSYPTKPPLFTVDIYSCKAYSVDDVVKFTKNIFNPIDLVWKEVKNDMEENMGKKSFEKEIALCKKLSKKNNGKCNWGECKSCGVIPLLYKLSRGKLYERKDEIDKIKKAALQ